MGAAPAALVLPQAERTCISIQWVQNRAPWPLASALIALTSAMAALAGCMRNLNARTQCKININFHAAADEIRTFLTKKDSAQCLNWLFPALFILSGNLIP